MKRRMSQGEFLMLRNAAGKHRVLDVDSVHYRWLVSVIENFHDLDLCHLAGQNISFVSPIAKRVLYDRAMTSDPSLFAAQL